MKLALLFTLLYSSQAFSQNYQKSRVHECENGQGFQRRLELRYVTPEAPVPCRVVFFRGDYENFKKEHLLLRADHEAGKCEASEQAYLAKMKNWNVTCRLMDSEMAHGKGLASVDEPKAEAPPEVEAPAPPPQWDGLYAGVVAGAQFGKASTQSGGFGYNADGEKWDYDQSGFDVAATIGYNSKGESLVHGPVFELGYLSMQGDGAQPASPAGDTVGEIKSDFYTALRYRLGAEAGRHLVFGSLGVIGVSNETKVTDGCGVAPCGGTTMAASKKGFDWGYTLGLGAEHQFRNRWSLKLEYMYFDLAERKFSGTTNLGDTYEWSAKTSGSIIRAGLSCYF
jgi:outer membrane immunogenic protein